MLSLDVSLDRGAFAMRADLRVDARGVALCGPSGAGKTTLLRVVAGLVRPDTGRVQCGDRVLFDAAEGIDLPPEARGVGFVPQHGALFPHLCGWRNVAFGIRADRGSRRARSFDLLDRLGVAHCGGSLPAEMSAGERQRVSLARALARDPRMLLLDEPLAALDPQARAAARSELRSHVADGAIPSVVVTHDFVEAAALAGTVGVMEAGRVTQIGTPEELTAEPASSFVARMTGATVIEGDVRDDVMVLPSGRALEVGSTVRGPAALCISPREIDILVDTAAAMPGSTSIDGLVSLVAPSAAGVQVIVSVPEPIELALPHERFASLGLSVGDRACVSWPRDRARVLAR